MTGFARVRKTIDQGELTVSLKSVNHRGLDLHFHMPSELDALENDIRGVIKSRVSRGHFQIHISFARTKGAGAALNRQLLDLYMQAFREASHHYQLTGTPDLNAALRIPGMLGTGDGNQLAYRQYGNSQGKPVLCLHGGPGSGCGPGWPCNFDPARYRVICLDQRNAGESLPPASDYATSLSNNTTWHLVADIERLRRHLEVERWMLFGRSWGSTLALVYAERHPDRVRQGRRPAQDLLSGFGPEEHLFCGHRSFLLSGRDQRPRHRARLDAVTRWRRAQAYVRRITSR